MNSRSIPVEADATAAPSQRLALSDWMWPALAWSARLAVACIFIVAAAPKITDPAAFAVTVFNYRLLPAGLVQPMAILLPWIELLAVVALVATPRWREAASLVLGGLLVIFMIAAGSALWRGLDISCGCFTSATDADPIGPWLFVRNTLMIVGLTLAVSYDRGLLGSGRKAPA